MGIVQEESAETVEQSVTTENSSEDKTLEENKEN